MNDVLATLYWLRGVVKQFFGECTQCCCFSQVCSVKQYVCSEVWPYVPPRHYGKILTDIWYVLM